MKHLLMVCIATVSASAGFYSGFIFSKKKYLKLLDEKETILKKQFCEYCEKNATYANENVEVLKNDSETKNDISVEEKPVSEIDCSDSLSDYSPDNTPVTDYTMFHDQQKKEGIEKGDSLIYEINEEDFANSEYEAQTIFCYVDGVVADDDYNVMSNTDQNLGKDTIKNFLDDACQRHATSKYIRNDILKIDYELLFDERAFSNINKNKPDSDI